MNDKPLHIPRYIRLSTQQELEKPTIKAWRRIVLNHAPSGVVTTIQSADNEGKPQSVSLVHRKAGQSNGYVIPLSRDLSDDEVSVIADAVADELPDLDFDIDTNNSQLCAKDISALPLDADAHLRICQTMAKNRHEGWMRERTNSGWRFGTNFNADEKTHPLLRPWDQLPDQFKHPDMDWPQQVVDILDEEGYVVISKKDLENILRDAKT